jgi:UDP-2,4-diacetamido-2,4,6-trideoxy-beta-L-altropyranose hydrolase
LAEALVAAGARCAFAVSHETPHCVPALYESACAVHVLTAPADPRAIAALVPAGTPIVIDHYGLDASYEGALQSAGHPIVAIEDNPTRSHRCDVLLDMTHGRSGEAYASLVTPGTQLLLGSEYACLRAQFAQLRPAALAHHREGGPVRCLLVSPGLSDAGITSQIVAAISALTTGVDIDVVLGPGAASEPDIRARIAEGERLRLHVAVSRMAELMATADIAIGGFGSTTWERCCLGLPTIGLVLADNQAQIAKVVGHANAALVVSDPTDVRGLQTALARLLQDTSLRIAMADAAADICDGLGARRVAQVTLALT